MTNFIKEINRLYYFYIEEARIDHYSKKFESPEEMRKLQINIVSERGRYFNGFSFLHHEIDPELFCENMGCLQGYP